ncbi:MAG TPA: TadE/TadG family type IV pilus assembly protein [Gaiellaceae bacterium]
MRRLIRSERGTALVEFALIAPILFLLVFGIIEFGRALNYYNDLTQLAGQGARAAVVSRNPDGTAVGACNGANLSIQCQIANTYPTDNELKNGISVCLGTLQGDNSIATNTTPSIGDPVTVRTRFKFHFLTSFFGAAITLSSTQTERLEAPRTWDGGHVDGPQATTDGINACDS